ncbi:MAG TPA: hypothetical protein VGM24_01900 [Puia sp.]|jgi:hypothetical protein
MAADLTDSILKVLAYFDLFDYPLRKEEIFAFLDQPVQPVVLSEALEELLERENIFLFQPFYSIRDNKELACRRVTGNLRAQPLLRIGNRISRILYQCPYVRAIGISGSLSKNFAAEDADIDYFIITRSDRLWIARTMLHLIKKFSFLLGRQHWFCMNYFIDEEALEIEEKNIFTAIELLTLLPLRGNSCLNEFYSGNTWTKEFCPNYRNRSAAADGPVSDSRLKKILESLFDGRAGDWLDNYFMRLTSRRWKKKEGLQKRSVKGNLMSLQTGKHFSKPNPGLFQKEILRLYQDNLKNRVPDRDRILL